MQPDNLQKTALAVTRWIGSPSSIVIHTVLFLLSFLAAAFGFLEWNSMLLVLTTIVSLEAIYLAIFIQMTLNYQSQMIAAVEKDIDEIQEDVEEIQEDVDELQEDVEDISEDVDEMTEEEKADAKEEAQQKKALADIQNNLRKLMNDISKLQQPKQ